MNDIEDSIEKCNFQRKDTLTIFQWNCRHLSLYNAGFYELKRKIAQYNPCIILLQEANTHYNEDYTMPDIKNYTTLYSKFKLGKVITLIRKDIEFEEIKLKINKKDYIKDNLYTIFIIIHSNKKKYIVGNYYRSPNGPKATCSELFDMIENRFFIPEYDDYIKLITGDFNAYSISWDSIPTEDSMKINQGILIEKFIAKWNWIILNNDEYSVKYIL